MALRWYHKALMRILDSGDIPEHIAIIMDGNRRYARKHHEAVSCGHKDGAKKLREMIEWLSELRGIKTLTVYAFSLLNFNRDPDEVKALMDLAESTFKEMADNADSFEKNRCKVHFIGRTDLLEERVKVQMRRVEAIEPKNSPFTLNICACYTSHDEIERSRDKCLEDGAEPNYDEVFSRLDIPSRPSLLIRTSGVARLSNFLLMQCAHTPIVITDVLWPEVTFYDVVQMLIRYQLRGYLD